MEIQVNEIQNTQIAEIISDDIIIFNAEEGLDLLGNIYYQGFDTVIIYSKNITPKFFDLSTGIAGEVLQKFSNYRIRLAIVGDLSMYTSKSLNDFIFESNKQGQINFVATKAQAIERLLQGA